jgi:NADH-quinone oxidoreductase subunit C
VSDERSTPAVGLIDAFPDAIHVDEGRGDVISVPVGSLAEVAAAARDAGFDQFIDLCAVDYLTRDPRFEVVVNLLSMAMKRRLRIRAGVPASDPVAPSITGVFAGANFYEREAWDLFGIRFDGHPDLTRILLPDDWEGHPLRKDTPVGSVPVQFKGSPKA